MSKYKPSNNVKTSSKKRKSSRNRRILGQWLTILLVGAIGTYITIISFSHADTASAHTEPFGIAGFHSPDGPNQTQQLNDYSTLGVQWARIGINWGQIQPTSGSPYKWDKFDTLIQQLVSRHIKVLGVIHDIPAWAMASGCTPGTACHPANSAMFGAFAGAAAAHFGPMGAHAWEIMNEVNSPNVWGSPPSATDYTADLKAAYTAIKTADSSARVVSAGLAIGLNPASYKSADYLTQMYAAGAHGYFDAVGEHPYCKGPILVTCVNSPTISDGWYQVVGPHNLHDVMVANGDGNKLVWITEFGMVTPTDATNEQLQNDLMDTAYAKQKALSWLGPLFWYDYQDGTYSSARIRLDLWGLVTLDGTHKPSFAHYTALAHATQGGGGPGPSTTPTPAPTTPNPTPKPAPTSPTSPQPKAITDPASKSDAVITPATLIEHPSRAVHSWAGRIITLVVVALISVLVWRFGLLKKLHGNRFRP